MKLFLKDVAPIRGLLWTNFSVVGALQTTGTHPEGLVHANVLGRGGVPHARVLRNAWTHWCEAATSWNWHVS